MSLRETAFRRYEGFISAATKGSHQINPLEGKFPCKASSFIVGMREAIRGWKMFKYPTNMWPEDYEMRRIKLSEGENGMVLVENEYEDAQSKKRDALKNASETTVTVDMNGNIAGQRQKEKFLAEFRFDFSDAIKLQEMFAYLADKEKCIRSPWTHFYGVKTSSPEEVEALKQYIKSHNHIDAEELQHGWWRIVN
jgi:hypothetical protein